MGDVPHPDLAATAIYARIGVVAGQLGIDASQLELSRKQLTSAVNQFARIYLDADFRRIALRTFTLPPSSLTRPGATYVEYETNPDSNAPTITLLVSGQRPAEDDLRLLGESVAAPAMTRLTSDLAAIGATQVAMIGQRMAGRDLCWLVGLELGPKSLREVATLADALGIAPYQNAMLGALHDDLASGGCAVTLAVSLTGILPELTVEYRGVTWEQVVKTAMRVRGKDAGAGFGVFAGAFDAARPASFEITFRDSALARARASIEQST